MPSYIIMQGATEFVRGDNLSPIAPDGMVAVEVPFPARDWDAQPDGDSYAVVPRPTPIEELRSAKLAEISAAFARRLGKGCASPKGWVDCDDPAQARISRVLQLRKEAVEAGLPIPSEVRFTMFDGSKVWHNQAELIALGFAIGFGFSAIFDHKQDLEELVKAAEDQVALDAVPIETGWP